jgi:hypothetical protein
MKKRTVINVFLSILFLALAGCATMKAAEHEYVMKGQILDVSNGQAYLCIGSADGAKAGQEFPVFRYERLPYAGPKGQYPSFKRAEVGKLKINQVVDVHYANASILSGDVQVHDVAELGR